MAGVRTNNTVVVYQQTTPGNWTLQKHLKGTTVGVQYDFGSKVQFDGPARFLASASQCGLRYYDPNLPSGLLPWMGAFALDGTLLETIPYPTPMPDPESSCFGGTFSVLNRC